MSISAALNGLLCIMFIAACAGDTGTAPTSVDTAIKFSAVSASGHGSCGLSTAGHLYCWGDTTRGNFGVGVGWTHTPTRFHAVGNPRFTSIAISARHACALTASGEAFCWGGNSAGQLGNGTNNVSSVPVAVAGGRAFQSIAVGSQQSCGLTSIGSVYCWGANPGDGVAGYHHNIAPVQIVGARTYTTISVGEQHACATTTTGDVFCWGDNQAGQLGDGTKSFENRTTPVRVLGATSFVSVSAGGLHNCALTNDGTAYCWGDNNFGRLGINQPFSVSAPLAVATNIRFSKIVAGAQHTCGIVVGTAGVACWGFNLQGQTGTGTVLSQVLIPTPVIGNRPMTGLALGNNHTCGVATDGVAYCWGFNDNGQLGNGNTLGRPQPSTVIH